MPRSSVWFVIFFVFLWGGGCPVHEKVVYRMMVGILVDRDKRPMAVQCMYGVGGRVYNYCHIFYIYQSRDFKAQLDFFFIKKYVNYFMGFVCLFYIYIFFYLQHQKHIIFIYLQEHEKKSLFTIHLFLSEKKP